jgi:hypothetical protein
MINNNSTGSPSFSIAFLLSLAFPILLSGCTKTDGPETEVLPPIKPEWRVKRTYTQSWNLKLSYGYDTADFDYDQRGRVTDLKYRLRAGSSSSSYQETVIRHFRYEYVDTTEKLKRYMGSPYGFYSGFTTDYTYDATGSRCNNIKIDYIGDQASEYRFHEYAGSLPVKYTFYYSSLPGYWGDTTEIMNEYNKGLLVKKTENRLRDIYGFNQTVTSYEYNEANNIKYMQRTFRDLHTPNRTDTTRRINFTWKPSPSPNTNKLKRLPQPYNYLSDNGGGGLFYFDSYALLNEVDIFNLAVNGQVLSKSKVIRLDHINLNPSEMDYEYVLDANNNIGKIIGTTPLSSARFETIIEYEKIP